MVKNTTARDIGICMIHETLFGSGVFGLDRYISRLVFWVEILGSKATDDSSLIGLETLK